MKHSMTPKQFFQTVLFGEIWEAMKVTWRHMFHKPMTFQYPREKRIIPDAHRGALCLLRYEDGKERCVGCDLCEAACPSRCIKVISEEDKSLPLERYASEFYIDITKCVFCGYCVEACPVNALAMTKMYEFSTHDKRTLLFDKKRLYDVGERHLSDAKKYLYAHNLEKEGDESRAYRYHFPESIKTVQSSTE
ncbi:MAG: NADH-quinone oxidoreductase subunit NuoI [Nitrospira sp.]|nr:NADH-quinone oxidoreductase subunit NuoI [Nitrospira sp.]MCB9710279.1 NADH-quinone oxidoreductase subunit NuoI [Nitrospiraceae bacterium]MDR4488560.1 NADH-quinone oxidoreductase subunit NuoI [Nitrospirales bacterium]MCA9475280.1 NADH-quinone oxidoreductase subunit NuoI [Nitrospira sp.]MCA9479509.1 NADH-quinone oxidoreductase subunit NuoI [Nitrospira sp.]